MATFQRDMLPLPGDFYRQELGTLTRPDRKDFARGNCLFHRSESKKSFAVNLTSGGFYCFGCGVKGGDIISFVRLRDGCTFKEACQRLGCWDEGGKPVKVSTVTRRYLVMDYAIDGVSYRAEILDEPKSEREQLRRFYHDAAGRLRELRDGDSERFPGEEETQWSILADSWELLRMEMEHG